MFFFFITELLPHFFTLFLVKKQALRLIHIVYRLGKKQRFLNAKKCSDRSIKVWLPALLWNPARQTNRPTDEPANWRNRRTLGFIGKFLFSNHSFRYCENNEWKPPRALNCTAEHCPLVDVILDYFRDNLVMFNIFIKVTHKIFINGQIQFTQCGMHALVRLVAFWWNKI